jgi:hypothetical protein
MLCMECNGIWSINLVINYFIVKKKDVLIDKYKAKKKELLALEDEIRAEIEPQLKKGFNENNFKLMADNIERCPNFIWIVKYLKKMKELEPYS